MADRAKYTRTAAYRNALAELRDVQLYRQEAGRMVAGTKAIRDLIASPLQFCIHESGNCESSMFPDTTEVRISRQSAGRASDALNNHPETRAA